MPIDILLIVCKYSHPFENHKISVALNIAGLFAVNSTLDPELIFGIEKINPRILKLRGKFDQIDNYFESINNSLAYFYIPPDIVLSDAEEQKEKMLAKFTYDELRAKHSISDFSKTKYPEHLLLDGFGLSNIINAENNEKLSEVLSLTIGNLQNVRHISRKVEMPELRTLIVDSHSSDFSCFDFQGFWHILSTIDGVITQQPDIPLYIGDKYLFSESNKIEHMSYSIGKKFRNSVESKSGTLFPKSLETLELYTTDASGEFVLPSSISQLSKLKVLCLDCNTTKCEKINMSDGIPCNLEYLIINCNNTEMKLIDLGSSQFNGTLVLSCSGTTKIRVECSATRIHTIIICGNSFMPDLWLSPERAPELKQLIMGNEVMSVDLRCISELSQLSSLYIADYSESLDALASISIVQIGIGKARKDFAKKLRNLKVKHIRVYSSD